MERNLMVAGFGGQGVMTMGKLLSQATCDSTDLNVTFFPSYGAAMRGGTANCYVVISDDEIGAPVSNSVDDLIVMNGQSLHKFLPNLKPGGTLFINSSIVKDPIDRDDIKVISVPVTEMLWKWATLVSSTSSCWVHTSVTPMRFQRMLLLQVSTTSSRISQRLFRSTTRLSKPVSKSVRARTN